MIDLYSISFSLLRIAQRVQTIQAVNHIRLLCRWLTSKTGQISVSVAADLGGRSSPEQHYYRGEPTQPITPSFDSDQKVLTVAGLRQKLPQMK